MRTTVFTGPKQCEVREIAVPTLGPRQVLVQTRAVGLCTFEQRFYRGVGASSYPFRGGHEVAGIVAQVGPQAMTDARPGDAVALALLARCGSCYYCRRGMDNLCIHNTEARAQGDIPGPAGLSDYVVAEDYQVYTTDDNPPPLSELALAEPVACVLRSAQLPPLQFGDTVLVQGAGIMGLLHVQLLKQRGVRVIMAEPDERRQQMARRLGADWVVNPLQPDLDLAAFVRACSQGIGANAAFFTAGGAAAIQQGLAGLAKGGWLCLYGSVHPSGPVPIDPNAIHYNEWVLTGTFSHTRSSFRQAVRLIANRQVDVSVFVSEQVAFPNLDYALQRALSADTYRVVMTFDT
jgi:L-iditol 2-dehydrogenase